MCQVAKQNKNLLKTKHIKGDNDLEEENYLRKKGQEILDKVASGKKIRESEMKISVVYSQIQAQIFKANIKHVFSFVIFEYFHLQI